VEAGLGVMFLPGGIASKLETPLTLQDILASLDLSTPLQTPASSNHHKLTNLQSFTEPSKGGGQEVALGQEEISVSVHPGLPPVKFVPGISCKYTVLAVDGNMATIQCGNSPDTALADLTALGSVSAGGLSLYNDGTNKHRVVVREASDEHAEVLLVDKGSVVVCDPTELFTISTELFSQPPAVVSARLVGDDGLEAGDTTATMQVVDAELVMNVE